MTIRQSILVIFMFFIVSAVLCTHFFFLNNGSLLQAAGLAIAICFPLFLASWNLLTLSKKRGLELSCIYGAALLGATFCSYGFGFFVHTTCQFAQIFFDISNEFIKPSLIAAKLTGFFFGWSIIVFWKDALLNGKESFKNASDTDIYIDSSALLDPRLLQLVSTGLLNNTLILPASVLSELNDWTHSSEESERAKGRKGLEHLKKLSSINELNLRYTTTPQTTDPSLSLFLLAKIKKGRVLVSDSSAISSLPQSYAAKFMNLQTIMQSFRPSMFAGESLRVKIQRCGKETTQGVGYLEDGTMVVVNGAGNFIGESIEAQVLSVKHTTSGRMIFCNALEIEEKV